MTGTWPSWSYQPRISSYIYFHASDWLAGDLMTPVLVRLQFVVL